LVLTAGLGGMILGLALRPSALPPAPPPVAAAQPSSAALAEEVAVLRQAIAAEQARLDAVTRARVEAEARFAAAQREASQRDVSQREASPREPTPRDPTQRDAAREAAAREALARREVVAVPVPPPAARPARPEPAPAAGPRIFVHYRGGSAAAAEAASSAAALLRDSGFEVGDLRAVQSVPAQRVVRYFHAEDAATAARLAGRLGRGWAIQDFRSFEPLPASQTLEIWLPER
jgi:hypothetical protein